MTTNRPTPSQAANDTVPAYPYHYFVSIQHFPGGGLGFFNAEVSLARPIRSLDDVSEIQDMYRARGYTSPLVMGYTLMRNDLADQRRRQS